jgi:hypothetical protein
MRKKIRPSGKVDLRNPQAPDDQRAEWERPALHHLSASDAEAKQKKSNDGVQGKGILS